jgi:DNA-binding CsgD family transcriptional regulator
VTSDVTEDALEPLLRNLLHRAAQRPPAEPVGIAGFHQDGARVLLDVEVDGARYQLLRSSAPVLSALVDNSAASVAAAAAAHPFLSPREREIVRMVALGHPNKTMAAVLDISCWTVGTYLRRIFAKLNVGSRAAMVARLMGTADLTTKPPPPPPTPRQQDHPIAPSPSLAVPAASPVAARSR